MPEPRSVQIALDGSGRGTVKINDVDVSRVVRGLTLRAEVDELPRIELELVVFDVSTHADVERLYIPEETEATLIALGWTPPPSEEHRGLALILQDPANRDAVTEVLRRAARVGEPWLTDLIARWHRIEGGRLSRG